MELASKCALGKQLEEFSEKQSGGRVLLVMPKELGKGVSKRGKSCSDSLAGKQKGTKGNNPVGERTEEAPGEERHHFDSLARNLDTVRDNLVLGHALGGIYCCFPC